MLPLLVLLLSDPVQPATLPTAPVPAAEKKVCWRDQVTGSMMPSVRICMTRAERNAWLAKMQGNVNALNDRRQRAPQAER